MDVCGLVRWEVIVCMYQKVVAMVLSFSLHCVFLQRAVFYDLRKKLDNTQKAVTSLSAPP